MDRRVISYRPEIDGLRAIAVILVLSVHMFPHAIENGFIGVDIFFVISGFLITSILVRQLGAGSFRLTDFYVRRANRIFPALTLVLIACLGFGWLSLFASEYKLLGRSAFSGAAFGANVNAFLEGGYWDIDATLKPLLHLWSLGVEEQFYLFWPLLLWVLWARRAWLLPALAVVLTLSLGWNLWFVHVDQAATFYLPFSRVWELAVGGLLAVVESKNAELRRTDRWRGSLALVGLGLIVAALLLPIPQQLFPGRYAILPVLGTASIIWAGTGAWASRAILAQPAMVYVGLISFPLYMWHYPVLAFTRILENGTAPAWVIWGDLVITIVLAAGTYHLVETPIRHNGRRRGAIALCLAAGLAASGTAGYLVYAADGVPARDASRGSGAPRPAPVPVVTQHKLVVLGDSNAGQLNTGLSLFYPNTLQIIASSGWPFLQGTAYRPGVTRDPSLVGTPTLTDRWLAEVVADPVADVVVLSNQYALYLWQELLISEPNSVPGETGFEAYAAGLGRTARYLAAHGKKVVVFASIPTRGDVGSVFACASSPLPIPRRRPAACVRPLADVMHDREPYTRVLERNVSGIPKVWVFDSLPYLCDERNCFVERDGTMLYGDMSHLGPIGSEIVGGALSRLVERIRSDAQ